jgi:prevent-host-death family protein
MKPKRVGAFQAKTHLSAILERVGRGQVYVITKRGRPVAELRPIPSASPLRFAADAGRIAIADEFDAPIPDFGDYLE